MGDIYSGNYKVLDSNMVIMFDTNSNLRIPVKPNLVFSFELEINSCKILRVKNGVF